MAEYEVAVPGVMGRICIAEPGMFSGAKLLVDGVPIARMRGGRYPLKKLDGTAVEARLQAHLGQYLPVLIVDSVRYQVGPKLPKTMLVLAFLPFGLVFVGGAIGGICGAIGWGFNNQLARTSLPTTVKVLVMLIVTVAAALAYFALATAFRLAIGK